VKTAAIVNPRAGGGAAARRWREAGAAVECRYTKGRGHATALARELCAAGYEAILAAGGDGTLNEVVNGVIEAGGRAAVGVIPLATGGDFARMLGIVDVRQALAVAAGGRTWRVDAARARPTGAAPRWFVNTASIGLGAQVAKSMGEGRGLLRGRAGYLALAAAGVARGAAWDVGFQFDEGDAACRLTTAALGNGRYQGGGMLLAPRAEIDDGLLDVTAIEAVGLRTLLTNLPALYSGAIYGHPKARHWRARRVRAEGNAPFEVDGEACGALPVEVEVRAGAWRVLAG
jgi:YegS/Rv2252/BmrU family lipid kinase